MWKLTAYSACTPDALCDDRFPPRKRSGHRSESNRNTAAPRSVMPWAGLRGRTSGQPNVIAAGPDGPDDTGSRRARGGRRSRRVRRRPGRPRRVPRCRAGGPTRLLTFALRELSCPVWCKIPRSPRDGPGNAQSPEAGVSRASRFLERTPESAAEATGSLTKSQVRQPSRIDPSIRPAAWRETGRSPRLRHKAAGQAPFTAGSRTATHSTCDVIGKISA